MEGPGTSPSLMDRPARARAYQSLSAPDEGGGTCAAFDDLGWRALGMRDPAPTPGTRTWREGPLGSDACGPDGGRSHGPVQVQFSDMSWQGDDTRVWHS